MARNAKIAEQQKAHGGRLIVGGLQQIGGAGASNRRREQRGLNRLAEAKPGRAEVETNKGKGATDRFCKTGKLTEIETAVCERVLRARAIMVRDLIATLFPSRPSTGYDVIRRLIAANVLIARNITDSRNLRGGRYVVLGRKGILMIRATNEGIEAHPHKPDKAERILLAREILARLVKNGVDPARAIERPDALRLMNLPQARAPLDWLLQVEGGYHSVHLRTGRNYGALWKTIRILGANPALQAHTVVCLDENSARNECERFAANHNHPVVSHYYVVSLDDEGAWRLLAGLVANALCWVPEMAHRVEQATGVPVVVESLPEHEAFRLRLRCGSRAWLIGDARLWDLALLAKVASANINRFRREHGVEGIALLTGTLRDARSRAAWVGWREGVWWVVLSSPPEEAVLYSDGERLLPDLSLKLCSA